MKKILMPIPSYGFDPTEVAIPWKLLTEQNFEITFLTPDGTKASADSLMLKGERLGIWKPVLRAREDAVTAFDAMEQSESFNNPSKYSDVTEAQYDAILLPGGHDKGVKEYLESEILQQLVVAFFNAGKPVAAICHGVILVARSIDPQTSQSVIHKYKTTSLLKSQELLAYQMTRLWLQDYYLTYPEMTVEDEVKSILFDPDQFLQGPSPVLRDDHDHLQRGFVVTDRNYISARWPGDAYSFTLDFIKLLQQTK